MGYSLNLSLLAISAFGSTPPDAPYSLLDISSASNFKLTPCFGIIALFTRCTLFKKLNIAILMISDFKKFVFLNQNDLLPDT